MPNPPEAVAASAASAVPFSLSTASAEIQTLIQARYPVLAILSSEEERVMANLEVIGERVGKVVFAWSVSRGLVRHRLALSAKVEGKKGTRDPVAALREILDISEPAIVVLKDFQPYLKEAAVRRCLRDLAISLRHTYLTVILLGPPFEIPQDLDKEITLVDFPLPTRDELAELLQRIEAEIEGNADFSVSKDRGAREQLLEAALGLTLSEAENVFAKALVTTGRLGAEEVPFVYGEKRQIVRKSGLLEYVETVERLEDIGGLRHLKRWLRERSIAFTARARDFGLPSPKGILFTGVQGCGKSLCAKAVATLYNMPLLRLDMGSIFGSYVGESESAIRRALGLARSVSPCVLWIDEIDKGLAGLRGSGSSDSGTTQRVFGTLVTWMQENKSPVFVVATANNIGFLPPEVLRKGRFDEIFFVDLPAVDARAQILGIHLQRHGRNAANFDLVGLAEHSEGFSGAELEAAVIDGLFRALSEGRDLSTADILAAIQATFPLSKTMREEIALVRDWAKGRARPAD